MTTLFDPYVSPALSTPNRIVMAPMTRARATADGRPTASMASYYAQRASAGLIITEGVQPSLVGQSNPLTPGLHNDEQVEGWRNVTDAVHTAGGQIFAQIMHAGRIGHTDVVGEHPVGPSAIASRDPLYLSTHGVREAPIPRVLTTEEVSVEAQSFAVAAVRAMSAGFDGVEIHGANGYLVQQFLSSNTNTREDRYGGSVDNRIRFAVEVTEHVAAAIGAHKVAMRLSPGAHIWDIHETDVDETYQALLEALDPIGMAYLHATATGGDEVVKPFRDRWSGTLMVNPISTVRDGSAAGRIEGQGWLDRGADLVSFGRNFISNPDLVDRFKAGKDLAEPDSATFYVGGDEGYVTYTDSQVA
jgi:N-ethylmaleimide reductase